MTLHRTTFLPALAASMSVLLLAGCPNAGTAPPLPSDAKFSAAPSMAPSAAPGTSSSAAPTAMPSGATSPAPSAAASPGASAEPGASSQPTPVQTVNPTPTGAVTILGGKVYDEEGAVVDGAIVTVKSLDTRLPFSGTATTASGSYVINNVPVGVQVDISVAKSGWTTRRRVTSLQDRTTNKNTLDFGSQLGSSNSEDPTGTAFFISDYPEIQSATPGASPITGDKLSYKVRFSEPLDEDNRDLVVNSFSIRSAGVSGALKPSGTGTDNNEIQESSSFLDNSRKVGFSWNAEGTELTMTLDAPLRADDNEDKSYTFRLTRRSGDELIEDGDGNRLGYTETAPTADYNAIKRSSLTVASTSTTADTRWDDTHNKTTSFDVKEDEIDPKVTGVRTSRTNDGGTEYRRISITFSEPMRVYPDTTGYADSLDDLGNYFFAFSEDNDLNGVDMDDAPVTYDITARTSANLRDTDTTFYEKPLRFTGAAIRVNPSDSDPNVVEIDIPEIEFPSQLKTLRVKVETAVTDPAGNKVAERNETSNNLADNVVEGKF